MPADKVQKAAEAAKSMQLDEIHKLSHYWDEIDLDKSGVVTVAEVHQFLNKLKIKIPDDKKAYIESHLDRNGNGTVEFVEFVKCYEKGLFKGYDMF